MKLVPLKRPLVLAALSTALLSTSAFAQIETVTVTAERRSQDVQSVPIAVTAVSAEQLAKAQVRDFNDLQMVAPSLLVSTGSGDTSGGLVRIRGVGTTGNNAGLEASVGVFVDGVYRSRSAAALEDLLDVDHIEVLRGPQGTLFGKNTTAGAITITSRKPSDTLDLEGTASGGTLSSYRFTGRVSDAITDDLEFSLAGIVSHREGYLVDVNDGHRSNEKNHWGTKGQLLWTPNNIVTLRVIGDYTLKADSGSGAAYKVYSTRDRLFQDVIQSPLSTNFGLVFPVAVALPQIGPGNQFVNYKTYKIAQNHDRVADVNDYGVSAQLDLNFDGATVTSISGYRHFKSADQSDPDYSPADVLFIPDGAGLNETISEELEVKGSSSSLDWLVGMYISTETIRSSGSLLLGTDADLVFQHILGPATVGVANSNTGSAPVDNALIQRQNCILGNPNTNAVCVANGLGGVHAPLYQAGDGYTDQFGTNGNTASAFTHNIWHMTDELDLTLGARVNYERKHGFYDGGVMHWHAANALTAACGTTLPPNASNAFDGGGFNFICLRKSYNQNAREGSLTGTANLSWKPNDDMMFYTGYSRGFKTGPFNLDRNWTSLSASASPHAKAETDDSLEAGSRMTLFDGIAIANTTLFYTRYHNFQINTFNGLAFAVANEPHVYSYGLEFEGQVAPTEGLNISASATWAHSYYGQDTPTPGFPTGAPTILAGQTLTQAPRLTLNGSVNYEHPIADGWTGFASVNANYRTHYNTGSDLNINKTQEAFALVNGQIGVRSEDNMWELAIWGRNIFNEHYNVVAFNTAVQGASGPPISPVAVNSVNSAISVFPGEPAIYGVTLSARME
jgi:iron complex outermembrane receptor protein